MMAGGVYALGKNNADTACLWTGWEGETIIRYEQLCVRCLVWEVDKWDH